MNQAGIEKLGELGYSPVEPSGTFAEAAFKSEDGHFMIEVAKSGNVIKTRGCAVRSLTKDEITALAMCWN